MVYIGENYLSDNTRLVKNTLYDCRLVQQASIPHKTQAIYEVIGSHDNPTFIYSNELITLEEWREIRLNNIIG